jgi:hypothetical protein
MFKQNFSILKLRLQPFNLLPFLQFLEPTESRSSALESHNKETNPASLADQDSELLKKSNQSGFDISPSSWTFMGSGTSNEQSGSATLPLWYGRAALGSSTAPLKQQQTFFRGQRYSASLVLSRSAGVQHSSTEITTTNIFQRNQQMGATFLFCRPVLATVFRILMRVVMVE